MSTVRGTQQVDDKCHCSQECIAPFLAIDSLILVYSPPQRRLQTFLTCHQAQTQEPKEIMVSEFPFQRNSSVAGTFETSRPLWCPSGPGVAVIIIPRSPFSWTQLSPSQPSLNAGETHDWVVAKGSARPTHGSACCSLPLPIPHSMRPRRGQKP